MFKNWSIAAAIGTLSLGLGALALSLQSGLQFWQSHQAPSPPPMPSPRQAGVTHGVADLHLFDTPVAVNQLPLSSLPQTLQGIAYSADPAIPSQAIISRGSDSVSLHVGEALAPRIVIAAILPAAVILREAGRYTRLPLLAPEKLQPSPIHARR